MSRAMLKRPLTWLLAATLLINCSAAWAQVTVTWNAPTNGSTYTYPPASIWLSATATAAQGYTISKVEFFAGTTLLGTETSLSQYYSMTWNTPPTGQHVLTAKATAIKKNSPDRTATSAAVNITVNAPPVVTTNVVDHTTYPIPPPNITVTAAVSDSDGTIARVEFHECTVGGLLATLTAPPYTYVWTLPPPYWYSDEFGTVFQMYGIRVDAIDNLGGWGTAGCKVVFVAPTISLTAPANGATFAAPGTIAMTATVSPPDVPITKMEFYQGTTLIGEDSSAPYSLTWQNVAIGNYSLTARAVADGFEYASTPVSVTVTAAAAQLHFMHADHLNTPRLIADATGTTVWRWDQAEPFGNNPADENPSGLGTFDLPLRLPGQYLDKETNLFYNYFRDYDPSLGRYVESDPIGLRGGLNTYAYVRARPLSVIDPSGLKSRVCCTRIPGIGWFGFRHCYIETENGGRTTFGLHQGGLGGAQNCAQVLPGVGMDFGGACGAWKEEPCTDDCVKNAASGYPNPSLYDLAGPNSNTFASVVAGKCSLPKPPGLTQTNIPGWGADPAPPFPGVPQIPPIWQPACPPPTPWGTTP